MYTFAYPIPYPGGYEGIGIGYVEHPRVYICYLYLYLDGYTVYATKYIIVVHRRSRVQKIQMIQSIGTAVECVYLLLYNKARTIIIIYKYNTIILADKSNKLTATANSNTNTNITNNNINM